MKYRTYIITVLLITCTIGLQGQGNANISSVLNKIMQNAREGKYERIDDAVLYKLGNAEKVLSELQKYYTDSTNIVRSKAYSITNKTGSRNKKQAIKQRCVNILLQACKDPDSGINGMAGNYLKYYQKESFTDQAKDSVRSLLKAMPPHYKNIIMLTGYLGLTDQANLLKQYIATGKNRKFKWAAHLALARMGVEEEIDYCLKIVKRIPVNDDVVYELLPDLAYTRQKKAIDYLITVLNSNEKNCESASPEVGGNIICGYRVMELLAPIIKNFPLKMDDSGDIDSDDYEEALDISREWMNKNRNDYEIDISSY